MMHMGEQPKRLVLDPVLSAMMPRFGNRGEVMADTWCTPMRPSSYCYFPALGPDQGGSEIRSGSICGELKFTVT